MRQANIEPGEAGFGASSAGAFRFPQPNSQQSVGSPCRSQNAQDRPACPECSSQRIYKDGLRRLAGGSTRQRYLCRDCGYRFSQNDTQVTKMLIVPKSINNDCRVCAPEGGVKNSAGAVKTLMEERVYAESRAAGATEKTSDIQSKILEFLWWMKKNGYKESTITDRGRRLRRLIKLGANLFDPESVKEVIANQSWSEARKEAMVYTYDLWAKWVGIKWERPSYKPPRKLPFIPLEREIDDLIASCNKYIATFLQMAKETGARAGEIYNLKWTDIDFENGIVTVVPEKGSDPRAFKISGKLITMLNKLPRNGDKVFGHYGNLNSLRRCFERYRRRAADKFGNPRLLKISFHTLRHWKATMEYAKTKDILHVMKTLGHRRIENTLIYTQLVKFESDEYVCKVAKEPEEIAKLIEAGFEYVCEHNGLKFFRKRK